MRHKLLGFRMRETVVGAVEEVARISDSGRARDLLLEIKRHADPLLTARGWYVKRLVEMCCCERRHMGTNLGVAGWCRAEARGKGAAIIALRVRHPKSHELYSLDQCLSVMWHEIAHITFSSHSADFYALIEDIRSHYELIKRKGLVAVDKAGFPTTGGQCARGGSRVFPRDRRRPGLAAAERRRKLTSRSCVLGGASKPSWHKSAVEAAADAAIRRARDACVGLGEAEEAVAVDSAFEMVCPVCGLDAALCTSHHAISDRRKVSSGENDHGKFYDLTGCDSAESTPSPTKLRPPTSPIDLTQDDDSEKYDPSIQTSPSSSLASPDVALDAEIAKAVAREQEEEANLSVADAGDYTNAASPHVVEVPRALKEFDPFVSALNGVQNFRSQRRRRA